MNNFPKAIRHLVNVLGEGAEEFTSGIIQPYLAKMWNGDERDFWQTLGESAPDAIYDGLLGAATSFGMSAPGNYANLQNARIVDAAIEILDNGGTLSDAQLTQANAALQELTSSWGDPDQSKWSRNAMQQWENARSGYSGSAMDRGQSIPPGFIPLPMLNNTAQNGPVNASEASSQAGAPAAADSSAVSTPVTNNAASAESNLSSPKEPVLLPMVRDAAAQNGQTKLFEVASQTSPSPNANDVSTELTAQKTAGENALQTDATTEAILSPVASNATITENGQFAPSKLDSFRNAQDITAKTDQGEEQNTIASSEAKEPPDAFHSDPQIVEIENEQNYRAIERGETNVFSDGRHPEINAQRITTYKTPVYVSENATIKPKALHKINRYIEVAMKRYNIPIERKPVVVIVSENEMPTAWGRYDAVNNVVYYSQWVESERFTETRASVEFHEMWHKKQAEEFRQRGWVITKENYGQYIQELCKACKKRLDAVGINEYDIEKDISKYARQSFVRGRFDEVEAELYSKKELRR